MTVLDWIKRIKRRPRPTGGPQPQVMEIAARIAEEDAELLRRLDG